MKVLKQVLLVLFNKACLLFLVYCFAMVLLCFPMDLLWFPMVFLCLPIIVWFYRFPGFGMFPMVLPCLPMVLPFSYGFAMLSNDFEYFSYNSLKEKLGFV